MIKDLRSVYSSILKCHSKRYISVVFVAFFDALMVFLSLNSIFETEKQKIYSGSPIAAIKVNAVLEGLTASNVMMLMLGGCRVHLFFRRQCVLRLLPGMTK